MPILVNHAMVGTIAGDDMPAGIYPWEEPVISFAFDVDPGNLLQDVVGFIGIGGHFNPDRTSMSPDSMAAMMQIVGLWDDLIAPQFVYLAGDEDADITVNQVSNMPAGANGFAYSTLMFPVLPNDADVFLRAELDIVRGLAGWETAVHEFGHAIGLQHPGSYDASDDGGVTYAEHRDYDEDTARFTVMSYFDPDDDGSPADWFRIEVLTPMIYDILAAQRIYGPDVSTRLGDTTYGFNSNADRWAFQLVAHDTEADRAATTPAFTIWDAGGARDRIDASGFANDQNIDLTPGTYSDIGVNAMNGNALSRNVGIAFDTWIEEAIGGRGNDYLLGNGRANLLDGGPGRDVLDGGEGDDHLRTLDLGNVDDLDGGAGANRLSADYSDKTVSITWLAGQTNDYLFADGDRARNFQHLGEFATGNQPDLIRLDGPADDGYAQSLRTNGGNDVIFSGGGSDAVDAGEGDDFVNGGSNATVHTFGAFGTVTGFTGPTEVLAGGAGMDTLSFEGFSRTFPDSWGNGRYGVAVNLATNQTGGAATGISISGFENLIGTDHGDDLVGDAGANIFEPLRGGGHTYGATTGGPDRIDGGGGEDWLRIDFSRADLANALGIVTNGSSIYRNTLGNLAVVDSYIYASVEHLNITGASQADSLYSNVHGYSDTLRGLGGNDKLGGNGGADTLLGGEGNDTLSGQGTFGLAYNGIAGGHDVFDGGPGDDLIENLAFATGSVHQLGADAMFQLDGGSGFDTLSADFANQSAIVWDSAAPGNIEFADGAYFRNFEALRWLVSGVGDDQIAQRGRLDNYFDLGGGNDTLNPGLGADTVNGGAGTDTLVLDFSVGDTSDLTGVQSSGTYYSWGGNWLRATLADPFNRPDNISADNIERVQITGSSKNDSLAGTLGDDTLFGGDGDDVLDGNRGGNNILDGGNGNDTLRGSYGDGGTGANDVMRGGAGNDTILPRNGSDTIDGGSGNDTLAATDFPSDGYGVDQWDAGDGDDVVVDSNFNQAYTYTNAATRLKLDGGAGHDRLSADYGDQTQDIVFIEGQSNSTEFANGSYFRNFETLGNFTSGSGNDQLLLSGRANNGISGGAGNDTINPGLGIDFVYGSSGIDLLILDYSQGDEAHVGGVITNSHMQRLDLNTQAVIDSVYIVDFNRYDFTGGSKADVLLGGDLDDRLVGNGGNDTLGMGWGSDTAQGGAGNDTITASGGSGGYGVDLVDAGDGDDVVSDIFFSFGNSYFANAGTRLQLDGGAGLDRLSADFGNQSQDISFIEGADNSSDFADGSYFRHFETLGAFFSGSGADVITLSSRFNNGIAGGAGNDTINPGVGLDQVNGGAGVDVLVLDYGVGDGAQVGGTFYNGNLLQRLNLGNNSVIDSVQVINFEQYHLSGGGKADTLLGGGDIDRLDGRGGDDLLSGFGGADRLTGGAGADTFRDRAVDLHGDSIADLGFDDVIDVQLQRFSAVKYDPTTGVLQLDNLGNGSYATRLNLAPGLAGEFLTTPSAAGQPASTQVRLMQDSDGDGIADYRDNAPFVPNPDQRDSDHDGFGNVIDADLNQDLMVDFSDLSLFEDRFFTGDADADFNGDGLVDFADLSMLEDLFGRAPGVPAAAPAPALDELVFDFSALQPMGLPAPLIHDFFV